MSRSLLCGLIPGHRPGLPAARCLAAAPARWRVALLAALLLLGLGSGPGQAAEQSSPAQVAVYFSPDGGATAAIVEALGAAAGAGGTR